MTQKYIEAQKKLTAILDTQMEIMFKGKTIHSVKANFNRDALTFIFTDGTVAEITTYKGDDELKVYRKVEP